MFKSTIVATIVLICGSALAYAQSDQQKRERTHQNIQTGIANTPVTSPPKVSTGTASVPFTGYTSTKTYESHVSGTGSSTIKNYGQMPTVPAPSTSNSNYRYNSQGRNVNPTGDRSIAEGFDTHQRANGR